MEFYAAEIKKELIPFAMARMELENIILGEINLGIFLFPFPLLHFQVFLEHL